MEPVMINRPHADERDGREFAGAEGTAQPEQETPGTSGTQSSGNPPYADYVRGPGAEVVQGAQTAPEWVKLQAEARDGRDLAPAEGTAQPEEETPEAHRTGNNLAHQYGAGAQVVQGPQMEPVTVSLSINTRATR